MLQLIASKETDDQVHDANQTDDQDAEHDADEETEVKSENGYRFCVLCCCIDDSTKHGGMWMRECAGQKLGSLQ